MNIFWPILVLIVKCIFPLVLSQREITNFLGQAMSLTEVKERNIHILKTLMNIRYSWSRLAADCDGRNDAETDFLSEKEILNRMYSNIAYSSIQLHEVGAILQEAYNWYFGAKTTLSSKILTPCHNLEGDVFRKWISIHLNKDLSLMAEDPIHETLENNILLLELYKSIPDNLKNYDADRIFGKINNEVSSIIEMCEDRESSGFINSRANCFAEAQEMFIDLSNLYQNSLIFTDLDDVIIQIFSKLFEDNSMIMTSFFKVQSKPASSTTMERTTTSTTTTTNIEESDMSLTDLKERTFNVLKTLMNIRYSWPRLAADCDGRNDEEINFLSEEDILNRMNSNIADTSIELHEVREILQDPYNWYLVAKNTLSPKILTPCHNLEGDVFRKWISIHLNKDLSLMAEDPIHETLENNILLLELYKSIPDNLKNYDADEKFVKINTDLVSVIKMYEDSESSGTTTKEKNFYFDQAQNLFKNIINLYYGSLQFIDLDEIIVNIFNKIDGDNRNITPFPEPSQSKPASSTTMERNGEDIKRTTEKSVTTSTTTTTNIEEPNNEDHDLVIKVEDYEDDKDEESLQDEIYPEDRNLMSHLEIASEFFKKILDQYECSKMPEYENINIAESNISPLLKLLLESVQRSIKFRQESFRSPFNDPFLNITEGMLKLMPKECGLQRMKNKELVLTLSKIINRYKKNFPTENNGDEYAKCFARCFSKLFSITGTINNLNFESRHPFRENFNDDFLKGANLEIQKCRKLKSGPKIGAALNIVFSQGV
ncbi:uncharacterized protein LOC122503967 [Leptopilina heterotoma]|uniref:uncharacterized protein LOC122503967 n=1 Tax=Leptopilina heterotoma TaxID=63436 RepID=UPI001CA992C0|nr:uncharacterized protein LOC122503967 [Leptopilina heterotoma]